MGNEDNRRQAYNISKEGEEMKDFFSASDFKRYKTIEDLENAKEFFQKIMEKMGGKTFSELGIRNAPIGSDGVLKIRFLISQIDAEIETRKGNSLLLENGNHLLLENGSRLQLTTPIVDSLPNMQQMNKEIKELRKAYENLIKELEHEKIQSDNSRRIIEWLTDQRGSFYKSDVEKDDE